MKERRRVFGSSPAALGRCFFSSSLAAFMARHHKALRPRFWWEVWDFGLWSAGDGWGGWGSWGGWGCGVWA